MALISLETGLVVRRGARTLEFVRLLEGNKVQFEDQLTRQVQTFTLARFYQGIVAKQLIPVLVEEPELVHTHTPVALTDISSLDQKYQAALRRRMGYVTAMRKRSILRGQRKRVQEAIPAIAKALEDSTPPSASSVMEWMRRFETSSRSAASLITGNRNRRRSRRINDQVEGVITRKLKTVYMTKARHTLQITLHHIRDEVETLRLAGKITANESVVSLATVQRRLKEFDPYEVTKARYGTQYARSSFRTSVEGTVSARIMERLQCDHTLLNWVVVCDRTGLPLGRPTLTIIVDSLSGYVVGLYVSFYGPGVGSVLNVLKSAIQPKDDIVKAAGAKRPWIAFGIGETLVLDNGMEFHAKQFQLAAWELGIDLEYCRVRTPWLKPKVERFFLNLDFLAGRGRVFKPLPNSQALDPIQDAAITFSDFLSGLVRFVVDVYPFEDNSRTLEMAFDRFKAGLDELPPPVFPTSLDQLDLVLAQSKELTVGPGGVEMLGLSYSSPDLALMKKVVGSKFRTLVKWDPDDLGNVYVQNPKDKSWLTVPSLMPEYTNGLSWIQHNIIRKHAREKRIEGGYEVALRCARLDIHELWMNPLARINRSADRRKLAKFTGLSSSTILRSDEEIPVPVSPQKLISKAEVIAARQAEVEEIPDYESFNF
ncbi:Mu transposase C-terminal domain-containing protein [Curvibacter lanceolatus]|uniref:Mu transposase C-terminal domain-containing protein n=1 Tax=Curvibacter lanceolatus TaxID=86182 RepID=UPI0009FD43C4|nr:Mu transposase C-terminal domain-containing protein [Curvibacter lanceolatus]